MQRIVGSALLFLLLPALCGADETTFQGQGCILIGEKHDRREARLLVRGEAVRRAIANTGVLDEIPIEGSPDLIGDIVQILRSGHIRGVKVLNHTETADAVCETIQARADLEALRKAVKQELARRSDRAEKAGLDRNPCLKILGLEEDEDRYGRRVTAVVQVLRATGALHTPERRRRKPCYKVCIDYLGPGGVPKDGESRYIDDSAEGMLRGEIRTVPFHIPREVQSYRVWLPREGKRKAASAAPPPKTAPSAPKPRPTEERAGPLRRIESIETNVGPDVLRLSVISNGPIDRHGRFFMDNPNRLVIDLPGRWKQPRFQAKRIESPLAERMRVGLHPTKLRLVLDLLAEASSLDAVIRETPNGMAIEVRSR